MSNRRVFLQCVWLCCILGLHMSFALQNIVPAPQCCFCADRETDSSGGTKIVRNSEIYICTTHTLAVETAGHMNGLERCPGGPYITSNTICNLSCAVLRWSHRNCGNRPDTLIALWTLFVPFAEQLQML